MHCISDRFGKIVKWSEDTKKLGKERINDDGEKKIPDEKTIDGGFRDHAFFPGDSGMKKVSQEGDYDGGN